MNHSTRLLSAVLSCLIAAAVFPVTTISTAFAGNFSEDSLSDLYDNTNSTESKASVST